MAQPVDETEPARPPRRDECAKAPPGAGDGAGERKVPGVPSHLQAAVADLLDQGVDSRPARRPGEGGR